MPVAGEVVTEIEALESLGVSAIAIGSGGLGAGEGSKAFQIEGDAKSVKQVMNAVKKIKGEKRVEALRKSCKTCTFKHCHDFRKR